MVCCCILPGNGQRVDAQVRGRDGTSRALGGYCEGNGATAGAKVQDAGPVLGGNSLQGSLHDHFRFRSGDQGMTVHPECYGTEFLLSGQVSDRESVAPAVQQAQEIRACSLRGSHFRVGIQPGPVRSERGREQYLGIKTRRVRSAEAGAGKL